MSILASEKKYDTVLIHLSFSHKREIADKLKPLEQVRDQAIDIVKEEYMKRILTRHQGSIKRAAEHAGLTTRSIHGKMKKFGLRKEDFKRP